jgi:hypothetical protein
MSNWGDVLYIDTPFRPEAGSFGKSRSMEADRYKVGHWHYCRELFHGQLHNLELFFFSHNVGKGQPISAFVQKVEDMVNVYPQTKFGPTQRKTIMWIEPSRWWTSRGMRRSLFTILLRCGSEYSISKNNFDEALMSDPYVIDTEYAVRRFLSGCTQYTGRNKGWHKQFKALHPSNKEIDQLLIKPV